MKVIVFYGTECNNKTAWIPWLKEKLYNENIKCIVPNLPTPQNQNYQTWSSVAEKIKFENDDVIVGWSTGAIFSVRYLFENKIFVKKLILISGFNNYVGNVPFVDNINKNFFLKDLKTVKNIANKIVCFKSDNDPFISQNALNDFAKGLNAEIIEIKNGGHFNSNAGYNEFPHLLNQITD